MIPKQTLTASLRERQHLVLLLALTFASRLPLVFLGYGYRPDAWGIAEAGRYWREHAQYVFSRPPGYPLVEGLVALTPPGAWWLTNSVSVLTGVLTVLLFYRLARYGLLENPWWSAFLLAVTPVFWITSAETLDTVYALFWILASYCTLISRRILLSALFLGIACGFRPTSGIFIVPSIAMLVLARYNISDLLRYAFIFGISGITVYLPVLLTYGLDVLPGFALRFWPLQIGYNAVQVFGVIGTIAIGVTFLLGIHCFGWRNLVSWLRIPEVAYALLAIVVVTLLFIRVPDHSEYWLPAVPFLLIFLDKIIRPWTWVAPLLSVLVLLSAILSPQVWLLDNVNGIKWDGRLTIQPGLVVQDWLDRQRQIDFARAILKADVPCGSVVMVAWSVSSIRYISALESVGNRCASSQPIQYIPGLSKISIEEMARQDKPIFWAGRASRATEYVAGFSVSDIPGVTYLDVGVAP